VRSIDSENGFQCSLWVKWRKRGVGAARSYLFENKDALNPRNLEYVVEEIKKYVQEGMMTLYFKIDLYYWNLNCFNKLNPPIMGFMIVFKSF